MRSHEQLRDPLRGNRYGVSGVSFSPHGSTLASSYSDGTVQLWDARSHRQLGAALRFPTDALVPFDAAMSFRPDGRVLAVAHARATITWDVVTHRRLGPTLTASTNVIALAFSPDGSTLAGGGADETTTLWTAGPRTRRGAVLTGHEAPVYDVAFSADGGTLATLDAYGTVRLWNVTARRQRGGPLIPRPDHGGALLARSRGPTSLVFGRDGRTLALVSANKTIRWDVRTHKRLLPALKRHAALTIPSSNIDSAISADGRTFAAFTKVGELRLWDVRTHKQLGAPPLRSDPSGPIAFSPDGRTIAVRTMDRRTGRAMIRSWDVRTHLPIGEPVALDAAAGVSTIEVTPDGRMVASGGGDGTIRLSDPRARKQLVATLVGHTSPVADLVFSRDGRTMASSDFQEIRLWDVPTRTQLGPPLSGDALPAFSPDGRTLLSTNRHRAIRLRENILWRNLAELRDEVCQLVGGGLSKTEWRRFAGTMPYHRSCP